MARRALIIRPEIADLVIPIDSVRPHPENPNNGDGDEIRASLKRHGQYRPIVVQRSTGYIIAGNHTYSEMMGLGAIQIAATFVDCDDDQARRILLVDNRTRDLARYDTGVLEKLLGSLGGDLSGTGWTPEGLDNLLARTNGGPGDGSAGTDGEPHGRGLGEPVIRYEIIFDTEEQQGTWFAFLRRLKTVHGDLDTIGERLVRHIVEWTEGLDR